jgi:hypothetical protein
MGVNANILSKQSRTDDKVLDEERTLYEKTVLQNCIQNLGLGRLL